MKTLVAICGYSGDSHQINMLMPYYKHHGFPVMVLSPSDAPIGASQITQNSGVIFRQGGKRAYIAQDSLDRQLAHFQLMLNEPMHYDWFLLHDSDSVVLNDVLPRYLYSEENTIWSNRICDRIPGRVREPGYVWPELAFQPPYFFSRFALQKLLEVAPEVKTDPVSPFIDWAMMAWAVRAGLEHRMFPEGASCPTVPGSDGLKVMTDLVLTQGKFFLHSIKGPEALHDLIMARVACKQKLAKRGNG